jgi:hypothetical protein
MRLSSPCLHLVDMVVFVTDIAGFCIYRAKLDEARIIRASGAMSLAAECESRDRQVKVDTN